DAVDDHVCADGARVLGSGDANLQGVAHWSQYRARPEQLIAEMTVDVEIHVRLGATVDGDRTDAVGWPLAAVEVDLADGESERRIFVGHRAVGSAVAVVAVGGVGVAR